MRRALVGVLLAVTLVSSTIHGAAAEFADPRFQAQWLQGEGMVPNFWGSASTAPIEEPYAEAPNGKRIVQYFDKGRMELTDPATGVVTTGLLAKELITGDMQTGTAASAHLDPPTIPLAGDAGGTGPTYATFKAAGAPLLAPAQSRNGLPLNAVFAENSTLGYGDVTPENGGLPISAYDGPTQHNVLAPFASFRAKIGFSSLGYAISEPFIAPFTVNGAQKFIAVQIFERRILTYDYANAEPYKTEFNNAGRHYYAWRYPAR